MSVNGVTGVNGTDYVNYASSQGTATDTTESAVSTKKAESAAESTTENTGVVYEKSPQTKTENTAKTYKPNTELINKLKADADQRTEQLRNLVQQLMSKQGTAFAQANDMWSFLASGKYTVSAAAKAQAQEDISEDGYWGVKQTSDRILDFAKALSGGDPNQIDKLRSAFEKGFKQATGVWGKDLPDISSKTYDAVMEKFDKWAEESKKQSEEASKVSATEQTQAQV